MTVAELARWHIGKPFALVIHQIRLVSLRPGILTGSVTTTRTSDYKADGDIVWLFDDGNGEAALPKGSVLLEPSDLPAVLVAELWPQTIMVAPIEPGTVSA